MRFALAIAALLFSVRGALLGAPVADDWAFLHHLRFTPFSWLDSFGGAYYWRPVSRQIAMSAEALWMERAPWVGALMHLVLLVALVAVLYRMLRRVLPAAAAAAVASAPLVTEASRALLTWPSGVQHLLAMLAAALVVHEAQARRLPTALLALAIALGSHESSVIVIPVLLWVARDRSLRSPQRLAWLLAPLTLLALWLSGYAAARAHGVLMPPQAATPMQALANLPQLGTHLFEALFGLEDLARPTALLLGGMQAAVMVIAFIVLIRQPRAPHRRPFAITALAGLVAALPLAVLLPDWNAWRASLPLLALAVGIGGLLASIDARLAQMFVTLRLISLLVAPTAPTTTQDVPSTSSDLSFVRLARLQRIVGSTREELLAAHPVLPHAARIRYWTMPGLAEVGFQQQQAAQVWYRDSTLTFRGFGGLAGLEDPPEVVLGYNAAESARPAVVMSLQALRLYRLAHAAAQRGDAIAVDSLGALTLSAQPRAILMFTAQVQFARASARLMLNDDRGADSLVAVVLGLMPDHAAAHSLAARLALRRGAFRDARALATRALELDPSETLASEVLDKLAGSALSY